MKTEEIKDLFVKFESIVCDYNGIECWSARDLY
ncbi:MAG: DNA replication protein DnaD, partial [Treponema sp.]|nr:DNA replication protein DnaD [Treponema sp.]